MSIIQGNAKTGASRGFYPKVINSSLRFNSADAPYLSYTNTTATEGRKCTLSFWIKKNEIIGSTTTARFIQAYSGVGNQFHSQWGDGTTSPGDQWNVSPGEQSAQQGMRMTDASLRDPSAWYHCVWSYNSVSGEEAVNLYVNGVLQTSSAYTGAPTTNLVTSLTKSGTEVKIGYINSSMPDFQLADMYLIDGQALTADDFGETKNGVWVAKAYEGTYGTNGFYLTFEDDAAVEAFNTVLWRGNGATKQSVTGMGFQPDLVWAKQRSSGNSHILFDAVRGFGSGKGLQSQNTAAEGANDPSYGFVSSADADGFTVNEGTVGDDYVNTSGQTYVAWGWKAGGAPTVDNSAGAGNVPTAGSVKIDGVNSTSALAGSIPATRLSASTTYGFSIVAWTGDGLETATVGHGLGVEPSLIIAKERNGADWWHVWHTGLSSASHNIFLNNTNAERSAYSDGHIKNNGSSTFGFDSSTSNVNAVNQSGITNIAYCWADTSGNPEGQRYSKFGSYSGGTSNYAVTTGFRPALVLIKSTTAVESWSIFDGTRNTSNPVDNVLSADTSGAEYETSHSVDFSDTGFDLNSTHPIINGSGNTYIYAAFADTREAAFWLDQSGNDNDWQPVNLDHNDTLLDSPTNNFCTLNPLFTGNGAQLADGNLRVTLQNGTNGWTSCATTMALPETGKYYAEFTVVNYLNGYTGLGFYLDGQTQLQGNTSSTGANDANWWSQYGHDPNWYNGGSATSGAESWSSGTLMLAHDADTGKVWWGRNGSWFNSGNPSTGANAPFTITRNGRNLYMVVEGYNGVIWEANFGQQPFKYDPPA